MSRVEQWAKSPHNVSFRDLCREAERHGFRLSRTRGSHQTYVHDDVREILTFTPGRSGKAKPYQIRLLRDLVDQYGLSRK